MRSHVPARRPRALHRTVRPSLRPAPRPAALPIAVVAALLAAVLGALLPAAPADARSRAASHRTVPSLGDRVVAEAARHAGKPYRWGASGPGAFDCSGFTRYVFGRFGRALPHNSSAQYGVVRHVPQADRRAGDLIFSYGPGGIYHVGIYAGANTIWHAPRTGDVVRRSPLWNTRYEVGRAA